ncbi:DNRLRE domain-containing protein [Rossellomorea marisflavi]|uniref:DNRLRE domain-containing protein n=1 Tax=Rossellomorea marisflavi TaxID=189381 RepID=UPI00064EB904|nr:DNRLRE domain-containing protein [Rossellomorea marisflavi]KML07875.1 hypothetical protein VL06_03140 [Rossellomorea marisflavi]
MGTGKKFIFSLLSLLLVFTSIPWGSIVHAEGNLAGYEDRLGLNDKPNKYTLPLDDPDQELEETVYSTDFPEEGEIAEERSATSKVFSNGDGTFTEEIYPYPIHTEEDSGEWKEISTDLIEDKQEGIITGEETTINVEFPLDIEDGKYVSVTNEQHQIEYELIEAEGPSSTQEALTPEVEYEENIIYHRGILPNVDMRSILFDSSLKEDIVLTKPVDYNQFSFQVHTDLNGELLENGSIEWKDDKKEVVFITPASFMMDSAVDELSGDAARSEDVVFELEKNEQGYLLTLTADQEWLQSKDRVYPVYIDPTTSLPTASDSYVASAYPTTNYEKFWEASGGYYSLRAGYYDGTSGTQYSYLQQNVSHLSGAKIDSASFNIYTAHSYYPSTATGLWIDAVNAPWSPSTITWNNKPASSVITSTNVYKGQWAKFDVTATVQQWVNGTKPNYGFKLHTNGNGQTFWKKFYSSENSSNKPYLSVTYSYPKPEAPTVKTTNYNDGTDTGYLDVSWTKVPGAKDYIVYLYNGIEYQGFKTGNVTSWSTKGKKIWPTDEQLYNGFFELSSTGKGQELPVNPSDTYRASGGKYAKSTNYWVRIEAVYNAGSSGMSTAFTTPYIPLSKTAIKGAASVNLDNATGYVSASWEPVELAEGYKVLVFNGRSYEQVADIKVDPAKPDQALQWHSQGKKIWPTPADVAAGRYALRPDGSGVELPKDPTPVYTVANAGYGANKNYYVRVKAYNSKNPEALQSDPFKTILPDKKELLGSEDYWPTLATPAGSVNAINGNLSFSETDASFSGRGPAIELARTYNSLSTQVGSFGRGWTFSYDLKLEELANKDVQLLEEDGTIHTYKYVSEGKYTEPHGLYLPITKENDQFILTTKSQDKLYFTNGRLTKIEDGERKENVVTLAWSTNQLLITDASNRVVTVTLANNRITQIKDYGNRTWTYTYSGDLLASYTDSQGSTYTFTYASNKLTEIKDAKGKSMVIGYDGSSRVTSVRDAVGKTTTLSYGTNQASITHPATPTNEGNAVPSTDTITYNTAGNPVTLTTDVGTGKLNLKTAYTYALHELVKTVDPRSGTETAVYDSEGNVLEEVGANKDVITATYNENNDVISFTDALKETYTTAFDGLLEVSSNDPSKTSAVSEYDAFGNVIRSTKEMSVAFNQLRNGGFEESSSTYAGWTLRNGGGDLGTAALTTSGAKQMRAITLTPKPLDTLTSGALSYVSVTQDVFVEENTLYTLSGLIKTNKLGGRAFFNIQVTGKDSNGASFTKWIDNRYHYLTGTNTEWTERQLSFQTPPGTEKVRIYLEADNGNKGLSGGTASFDNIQLEYGQVSSSYNPVVNSGFEETNEKIPTAFTGWDDTGGGLKGNYDEEVAFDGDLSVKVLRKKTTDPRFFITQSIVLNQPASDPKAVTVSAVSKAENVLNGTSSTGKGLYYITLYARDAEGVEMGKATGYFALGTHEWQKAIASYNPPRAIKDVTIEIAFRGDITGTAWFDSVRLQEGLVASSSAYDSKGNFLTSETDVLGNKSSYEYDAVGNQTKRTDAKGNVTAYTYNQSNQIATTSLPGSDAVIHYGYDANGNNTEKSVRSKQNSSTQYGKTTFQYDDAGQLMEQAVVTKDAQYKTKFEYNARGEIANTIYPTGSKVSMLYDSADRPITVTHTLPGGTAQPIANFKLDGNGNQTEIHNLLTNTKVFQTFDAGNRVTSQTSGVSKESGSKIDWTFDANDNVTKEVITQGSNVFTHQFKYNTLNYNTELLDPSNKSYRFQYDEVGNVKTYTAPNGTGVGFTYDERDLVKSVNTGHNDIPNLVKFDYVYNQVGNRTAQSITQQFAIRATLTGKAEYDYDAMNQLKWETVPLTGEKIDYTYDVLGNRTKTVVSKNGAATKTVDHTFNERNQLVQVKEGSTTSQWTYDDNGNLLSDGEFLYEWDADNRLRKVKNASTSALVAEYWYDEADRRIRKSVGGVVTNYIYDGDGLNVLYETNANDVITAYHTYNTNGQLLARTEGSTRYYYHYNAHGDVVMVTKDGGTTKANLIVASYVYDAWGNILYQEGSYAAKNPYRYAGYQFDVETNNYYLMARYYNPKAGVFTSMDPDPGDDDDILTQNGYTYANNNPVMLVDPDGHYVWLAINAGFAAYDGYKAYKAGKKSGKKGWKLAGSVAWAAGSNFLKIGHLKKAGKVLRVLEPGPFAKKSIRARSKKRNFTAKERRIINKVGYKYGCHSCGAKSPGTKKGNYICDHQPANQLCSPGASQRLYPHCKTCSAKQGGIVSGIIRKKKKR